MRDISKLRLEDLDLTKCARPARPDAPFVDLYKVHLFYQFVPATERIFSRLMIRDREFHIRGVIGETSNIGYKVRFEWPNGRYSSQTMQNVQTAFNTVNGGQMLGVHPAIVCPPDSFIGIELDERGAGDVAFTVSGTAITGNGSFDPDDLDDGMDVDESGDGAVRGVVKGSTASDNFEEGWDFNENDAGDFVVDMTNVHASRNGEEGVDFEEDDDDAGGGDLVTTLVGVTADDNAGGDAGIKIREKGAGSLAATVRGAQANGNDEDGINVREDDVGDLEASVAQSTTAGNGDDGVNFDENADGDLTAATSHGTSSENGDDGVVADEGGSGAGTLDVFFMTFAGNGGSDVAVVGDVTVTRKP